MNIDFISWIESVQSDPIARRQREVTEIILHAIAMTPELNGKMLLKGGILMGLAYRSPRQTNDIDLTTTLGPTDEVDGQIVGLLNQMFPRAAAKLGYTELLVRVQSAKRRPREKGFSSASAPALCLKIAYAESGGRQAKALAEGKAASTISVDFSFNEPITSVQILMLDDNDEILAYSLVDMIAEKYRAMIQQKTRNRMRRQDPYDLARLIQLEDINKNMLYDICKAIKIKCRARDIIADRDTLRDPDIRKRSGSEWHTLEQELPDLELPDFELCFDRVLAFYESLPWDTAKN